MFSRSPGIRVAQGFSVLITGFFWKWDRFYVWVFALDDAKGNTHPAEWCAGADVVFYVSLVAADKALAGLGQCRFIVCIAAGFVG